jgi:hypothetical protein
MASPPSGVAPTQVLTSGTNGLQGFGTSIAIDGRTMVIGAPWTGSGAAFIHEQHGSTWTLTRELGPPHPLPTFGYFGQSVGVSGDTVVIGLGVEGSYVGESYVYRRGGANRWDLEQIIPSQGLVAINGDTIVVAHYAASVQRGQVDVDEAGAAYVYARTNGTWTFQQELTANDARDSDYFGRGLAIDGHTIVIGAIGDLSTSDESGAAYVFQLQADRWVQTQKLRAGDPQRAGDFGRALDLKGDLLVVGMPGYVDWTDQYRIQGFAYVFVRSGNIWIQQQKLSASDAAPRDGFGVSVGVTEHQIVVGQFNSSAPDYTKLLSGAAYVFRRQAGSWIEQGKLAPNTGQKPDIFGLTLAADGDTLVVGDPTIVGSAYVYEKLVLGRLRRQAPDLSLSFASEPSREYAIECADSLPASSWRTVTNVIGNGSIVDIPLDPASTRGFYRVRPNP